jgi:hypothetical protein
MKFNGMYHKLNSVNLVSVWNRLHSMNRLVLHSLNLMLGELLGANREFCCILFLSIVLFKLLISSNNSTVVTTTYICRMVFHCMSCQFLFQKVKRCRTGKAMTCAASVQMVGSFSFVIPAQELFTEVMTWFIADRRFYQNNPPENLYIDRHISKRVKGILIKHRA